MYHCLARWALSALLAIGLAAPSIAADIVGKPDGKGRPDLILTGDIVKGDAAKFRRLLLQYPNAFVFLASDGGDLEEALEIGRMIQVASVPTAVLPTDRCLSACALIWLSGNKRILAKDSIIGFHAAYTLAGTNRAQESGAANALVGRYLTQLNLSERAIMFATTAPPEKFNFLTVDNLDRADIAATVVKIPASSPSTVSPPPIVRTTTIAPPPVIMPSTPRSGNQAEPYNWARQGAWQIVVDPTIGNQCFMMSGTQKTAFRVGIAKLSGNDRSFYVAIGNTDWQTLKVGAKYDLAFQFDSNEPWNVPVEVVALQGGFKVLMAEFTDIRFWEETVKSYGLSIKRDGRPVTYIDLSGSAAAFNSLIDCQKAQATRAKNPFAD